MKSTIKNIAISTGGGDAPGLNAVIRSVVMAAAQRGWQCYGIRDGFNGILLPQNYPKGGMYRIGLDEVRGIGHLGGTILGTTNHGNPLKFATTLADGSVVESNRSRDIVDYLRQHGIDALVCVGGDGTLTIAHALHQLGLPVVGVPKTIDNDLDKTFTTFGFDTAVSFATECVDRLHSTAESHQRIMVVEVMGRYAGWIALHAGIAANAHAIVIPEHPYQAEKIAEMIQKRDAAGRRYSIIVAAEGAAEAGDKPSISAAAGVGYVEKLGGIGDKLAQQLQQLTGKEARSVVLGHLLRGGSPTAFDRLAAMRFGAAAVRALDQGLSGVMVALAFPNVNYVDLAEVAGRMKAIPPDSDTLQTALDLGICLG